MNLLFQKYYCDYLIKLSCLVLCVTFVIKIEICETYSPNSILIYVTAHHWVVYINIGLFASLLCGKFSAFIGNSNNDC
jgi:hypothetical protein